VASDLYQILGVPHDADAEDIRRAYRRLARELHPDVNGDPGAEERFKEITGAYEILSDPQKRARYDALGTASPQGFPGAPDLQDIFEMFFGQGFGGFGGRRRGPRRTRAARGEDLGARVDLALEEAAFGISRTLDLERLVTCDRCLGVGAEPGTTPAACGACGGSGEVQQTRRSVFGTIMTSATCGTCAGTGQVIPDPCESCAGQGRKRDSASLQVDIPAGVSDGMDLRVPEAGHAGFAGGPPGDLFVSIHVEPSQLFERRGQDLHSILEVPFTQVALGAELLVTTLDGDERVRIEPGTPPGSVIRLRGKGVPNLQRRGRGDLYVTIQVSVPSDPSKEERQLLERLAEVRDEQTSKREPARGTLRRPER
jgi:molecular chaperone DnaJ